MFVTSEWDLEGRRVDPRDVAPAPVTAFARQQAQRFTAVLSATSTVLDERDQLELLREATGCKATLDWLVCRTVSSLACKDSIQRREVAQSRSGAPLRPGGGEMMPLGGEGTPLVCEFLVPEVALELCCSEGAARDLIAVSLDLRFRLPSTNATFGGGRLTLAHARVISEMTRCLSEDDALRLDERLAEAATTRTPARLRVLARRWVAKLCPESFRRRHRAAVAQRSTAMFATQDGMAAFCLDHQLETLAVIDDQLDAWARQRRSLDPATSFAAHKADAATHLLLGQHPVSGVPAWGAATRHAVLGATGQGIKSYFSRFFL